MRFELFLTDVSDIVSASEFQVFSAALAGSGVVKAICLLLGEGFPAGGVERAGEAMGQPASSVHRSVARRHGKAR